FWHDPSKYLPYYLWDRPSHALEARERIRSAFQIFENDMTSQAEFVRQVRLRVCGDFRALQSPEECAQYFPAYLQPRHDEVFADCGAFDGDSIRDFLKWNSGSFAEIVAFEPDPKNAAELSAFASGHPLLAGRFEVKA